MSPSIIKRLLQNAVDAARGSPVRCKRRSSYSEMERLETRNLLSTITWGNASGGDFNTASNWIGDAVPGSGDNAVILVAGGVTITYTSGTDSVQSITSSDPISISGGSLTLTSGASALSDGLTVSSGATLTVTGGSTSLTATGTTTINGNLTAAAGGTITLSSLTSLQPPTTATTVVTLEATGTGSVLDLSHVTSLTGAMVFDAGINIEALAGGDVKLTNLPSITAQVFLESDGSGSVLNLSSLTSLSTTSDAYTSGLQATNSGQVLDASLTTVTITALASLLSGPTMTLDGTSAISTSQITTFTGGQLNITGGAPNFSGLTSFNASGATVSGGSTLTLSALTSYQTPITSENVVTLEATGAGSILDLSHVTSLTGPNVFDCGTNIEALAGGQVKLTTLPSITGQVFLKSDGSGSVLNLSDLTSLSTTSDAYTSGLQCTNSSHVLDPLLTTITLTAPAASLLSGPTMTLDGTSVISTSQIATFTGGQLNITGGSYSLVSLTHFNASGATASAGGTLTLPSLTSYQTPTVSENVVTMEATGAGSILNLSALTSLTGPNVFDAGTNVEALGGGEVNLSGLTSITGQVFLESDGSGSVLNLSNLTTLSTTSDAYTSGLQCTNSGHVLDGLLTTITLPAPATSLLSGPTMTLDGTSVISTSQITTFTGGQLNISAGSPNFTRLTNFNASGAMVSAGGTLTLPALTSYQTPTVTENVVTLEATGTGSLLDLSPVTSLTGPNVFDVGTNVEALAGGEVKLSGLTSITGQVFLKSDGSGSVLNLSNLTTLSTTSDAYTSGLQCTNSGTVLDGKLTTVTLTAAASQLSGPTLTLDGTGTMATSQITSITGGQLNITGGSYNLTGLTNFNASGATVSAGGTLTLPALTSYQTPTVSEVVTTLETTGAGSTLDLPNVASLTGPTVFDCGTKVEALAGGYINLSQLITIDAQAFFEADGANSVLDLSHLINVTTTSDAFTSGFQASNSGQILRVGSATKLAFGQSITGVVAGATLASVTVHVEYGDGQTVPTDSSSVTLTLAGTYSTITGALVAVAQNGVATFSNLVLPLPGTYSFTAGDGALTSATSNTFTITPTEVQKYVIQIYSDILHRVADAGGLTYWTAQLNSGAPSQSVALGLSSSLEYYDNLVNAYYETYLNRAADTAGINHWAGLMAQGVSPETIRVDIVSSQEYYNDGGGTAAGYINELYSALLGRPSDPTGLSAWETILSTDGKATVASGFIYSQEYFNDVIDGFYETYLHRAADPGGQAIWAADLVAGVSEQVIIADFTSSAEYLSLHDIT